VYVDELLQPGDPESVGQYHVVKPLGRGGMGRVFLAVSPGGRAVAVKVIHAEYASDPEFRVRFRREVAAARKVSGLYTAGVVDADTDGPVPWLATAYVSGPSLGQEVKEHGPLPPRSLIALAAGLAEGVSVIHAAGVVHRDLTPSNVMLAEDGPRIIDFGISRAADVSTHAHSTRFGTPGYHPPELLASGSGVGAAGDIFSLGAVLAFASTGTGPFGAGSFESLAYRVVHEEPDLTAVPAEIRALIQRCLAKDPAKRPTAADVLAELTSAGPRMGWQPGQISRDVHRDATPAQPSETATVIRTRSPAAVPPDRDVASGWPWVLRKLMPGLYAARRAKAERRVAAAVARAMWLAERKPREQRLMPLTWAVRASAWLLFLSVSILVTYSAFKPEIRGWSWEAGALAGWLFLSLFGSFSLAIEASSIKFINSIRGKIALAALCVADAGSVLFASRVLILFIPALIVTIAWGIAVHECSAEENEYRDSLKRATKR
jgi:Protein kinase domain